MVEVERVGDVDDMVEVEVEPVMAMEVGELVAVVKRALVPSLNHPVAFGPSVKG